MFKFLAPLAAALTLLFTSTAGTAMATKGQCDPAPAAFNTQTMTLANGEITVDIRYGWDGVSVFPSCVGPILRIRVQNLSDVRTWYAHVQGRRGQPQTIAIPPGDTSIYSGAALANHGITTLDDIADLTIDQNPTNTPG